MNCPQRLRESADPKAAEKEREREELEELEAFLAGPEEHLVP